MNTLLAYSGVIFTVTDASLLDIAAVKNSTTPICMQCKGPVVTVKSRITGVDA